MQPRPVLVTSNAEPDVKRAVRSPARQALAEAIENEIAHREGFNRTAGALNAVSSLLNAEAEIRAKLDQATARDSERVVEWVDSGATGKLELSSGGEIATLQRELADAAAIAAAARASQPELQSRHEVQRQAMVAARARVENAGRQVLLEEATATDSEIQRHEAEIVALQTRLYGLGNLVQQTRGAGEFLKALHALADRSPVLPKERAVQAAMEPWRDLRTRLAIDPDATFKGERA